MSEDEILVDYPYMERADFAVVFAYAAEEGYASGGLIATWCRLP